MRRVRLLGSLIVVLVATACSRPTATPLPEAPLPAPTPVPALTLPRDAAPHDGLMEWWYFTGHLHSESDARTYGFEYTVFQSNKQGAPTGYLAHFAISDINGQSFSHESRVVQRDRLSGFPIDVDGWRLDHQDSTDTIEASMRGGAEGAADAYALRLELVDEKPPALHHGGYIDYGPAGGSYYYSRTRLRVAGELRASDSRMSAVSGIAWMDHQWGNFVVSTAGGWDWYSLQLDDATELMLYVLRGDSGETTGVYGTQVLADGTVRDLEPGSVRSQSTGTWVSPHTGGVYPSGWHLSLADGRELDLQPELVDQELYFPSEAADYGAMPYWEGAVTISGAATGVGYVELTGYARPSRRLD